MYPKRLNERLSAADLTHMAKLKQKEMHPGSHAFLWRIQDFPLEGADLGAPTSGMGAFWRKHMRKQKNWVPESANAFESCGIPISQRQSNRQYLAYFNNHIFSISQMMPSCQQVVYLFRFTCNFCLND